MVYFVDFEAFQHGDEPYEVKELCIVDADQPFHFFYKLFGPQESWNGMSREQRRTYCYQTRHVHGIDYHEGYKNYCPYHLGKAIKDHFPGCVNEIFYIMGRQKLQFMKKEYPQFNWCEYNATLNDMPSLPKNIVCLHRTHDHTHCALLKACKLYQHYINLPC